MFSIKTILAVLMAVLSVIAPSPAVCAGRAMSVVCSLWPVYDFARIVAAGTGTEVRLLLPPGVEAHSFSPRPSDIKALNDSDVFVYTGADMEPWAERLGDTLNGTMIVNASKGVRLLPAGEHGHSHAHSHGHDPHVWLDLDNVLIMVRNIASALRAAAPEHGEAYMRNADDYCAKIAALDDKIRAAVNESEHNTLVFAGRFAYRYFLTRYGLDYVTAYGGEAEPGPRVMAGVARYVREHGVRIIFRDELPVSPVTRGIAGQTGAELKIFHTCHNLTQDEFESGRTFLDVMEANAAAVAEALKD